MVPKIAEALGRTCRAKKWPHKTEREDFRKGDKLKRTSLNGWSGLMKMELALEVFRSLKNFIYFNNNDSG